MTYGIRHAYIARYVKDMVKKTGKEPSPGLFSLSSAADLFKKAEHEIKEFYKHPNDYLLFNLLCTLNHLRDWICPGGYKSYETKSSSSWTYEERFHHEIYEDPDFQIVNQLCNNAKHFKDDKGIGVRSATFTGFFWGFNFYGDSFNHRNYVVGGEDLRKIFGRVFLKYKVYFDHTYQS